MSLRSTSQVNLRSKGYFKSINDQKDLHQTMHSNDCHSYNDDWDCQTDLTIQEDCLLKLKVQRKKIQELTYLYQCTRDDLRKEEQKVKHLQVQFVDHEQLKQVKVKSLILQKQYEAIQSNYKSLQQKNQKLKQKLTEAIKQNQQLLKLSSIEKGKLKQENYQATNQFNQYLKDKEDQISRIKNVFEVKQSQYLEQVHQLNATIQELKKDIVNLKNQEENQMESYLKQLSKKDQKINKMNDAIDNMKEENKILRFQLRQIQKQFNDKQTQWLQTQDTLIHEINQYKRKYADQQHLTDQLKYKYIKSEQKLKDSSQENFILKQSLKKINQQSNEVFNDLTFKYEQKLSQYKDQLSEMKQSLEQLLQVKDVLLKENQSLKEKMQKEDVQKKRRRQLMRSQMRQIEKFQNAMKRVM